MQYFTTSSIKLQFFQCKKPNGLTAKKKTITITRIFGEIAS